jgi:uncharacterized membrane protein YbaN (DUF454 family)
MIRGLYIVGGWIFVVIGVIGIVTPLLPSTPFLLLAAGCFAKSSTHFHQWLMTHPKLSQPVIDWQKNGVIRRPAKILATTLILLNALFPLFIIDSITTSIKVLVCIVMGSVLIFLWTRPSQAKSQEIKPQ